MTDTTVPKPPNAWRRLTQAYAKEIGAEKIFAAINDIK